MSVQVKFVDDAVVTIGPSGQRSKLEGQWKDRVKYSVTKPSKDETVLNFSVEDMNLEDNSISVAVTLTTWDDGLKPIYPVVVEGRFV